MNAPDRRQHALRPFGRIWAAADASTLVSQAVFESIAGGFLELGREGDTSLSLLILHPPDAVFAVPGRVAQLLVANLRQVDVIGQFADGTFGLLLDALMPDALAVAQRLVDLMEEAADGGRCWIGVVTATDPAMDSDRLVALASVALGRARSSATSRIEAISPHRADPAAVPRFGSG